MKFNIKKSLLIIIFSTIPFFSIFFLWQHSFILDSIFLLFILFILLIDKKVTNILFALSLFVSCALVEILSVHLGIWTHTLPDLLGIPLWVPLGWVLFAFLALHFYFLLSQLTYQITLE